LSSMGSKEELAVPPCSFQKRCWAAIDYAAFGRHVLDGAGLSLLLQTQAAASGTSCLMQNSLQLRLLTLNVGRDLCLDCSSRAGLAQYDVGYYWKAYGLQGNRDRCDRISVVELLCRCVEVYDCPLLIPQLFWSTTTPNCNSQTILLTSPTSGSC